MDIEVPVGSDKFKPVVPIADFVENQGCSAAILTADGRSHASALSGYIGMPIAEAFESHTANLRSRSSMLSTLPALRARFAFNTGCAGRS
jgi:hypothetical protein